MAEDDLSARNIEISRRIAAWQTRIESTETSPESVHSSRSVTSTFVFSGGSKLPATAPASRRASDHFNEVSFVENGKRPSNAHYKPNQRSSNDGPGTIQNPGRPVVVPEKHPPVIPPSVQGDRPSRPKYQPQSKPVTASRERLTTRRKNPQETLFFGDGLYDLSTEHSDETAQFQESLARLRQQYSCSNTDTNNGHVFSPQVPWMPIGHSQVTFCVSTATSLRPLSLKVEAISTVADVIAQIVTQTPTTTSPRIRKHHRSMTAEHRAIGVTRSIPEVDSSFGYADSSQRRCSYGDGSRCSSSGDEAPSRPLSKSGRSSGSSSNHQFSFSAVKQGLNSVDENSQSSPVSPSYRTHRHTTKSDPAISPAKAKLRAQTSVSTADYLLKVAGRAEIFKNSVPIGSFQYIHRCLRFNKTIHLELVQRESVKSSFPRSAEDDQYDSRPQRSATFMPVVEATSISKRGLDVLMETFSKECDRLVACEPADVMMHCDRVIQTSKAFIVSLASVESAAMTDALTYLKCCCAAAAQRRGSQNSNIPASVKALRDVITEDIQMYCRAFELGVDQKLIDLSEPAVTTTNVPKDFMLSLHICSAHRLRAHIGVGKEPLGVFVSLEHAGQLLVPSVKTELLPPSEKIFLESVSWKTWIDFIPLREVPREAMLRFVLFKQLDKDKDVDGQSTMLSPEAIHPVAAGAVPVFNYQGHLVTSKQLLGLWPANQFPPFGFVSSNIVEKDSPVIQFQIRELGPDVRFPEPDPFETMDSGQSSGTTSLKDSAEAAIRVITRKGIKESLSDAEKKWLWEQRYLCWRQVCATSPNSIGLFLSAVPSWAPARALEAHALARSWSNIQATAALGLLDGQIADSVIRGIAADKMRSCPDYQLCDMLPQLLQAIKFDQAHLSPLVAMLYQRAMNNVAVAHRLFWNLHILKSDKFFSKRFNLLHAGLQTIVGTSLRAELDNEMRLMNKLNAVALEFKNLAPSNRPGALAMMLENNITDIDWPVRLPIDPGMEVTGLLYEKCSFFSSNAVPLKLTFQNINPLRPDISCIYKIGDDLRQDQIVLQMLRVMDNLWQQSGLDLRIITYQCLAFSEDGGILEIVDSAATLREIQTIDGVTGSFKDSALLSWLSHHNTKDGELSSAVDNFTLSCAGYCVATYILGVCDRHNDNIMIRRSGHLFHIDFGRFLGNAQKFGSFKRDRTPFVLTPDMAYVINNGEQISPNFQEFVDTCCQAFNILRHHTNHVVNMLALMRTSGMEELAGPEDVQYVVDALMPNVTDLEATTAFTRMIEDSLSNWFTKINFFIHNLGQLKSSTADMEAPLLSFCPRNASREQAGVLSSAVISNFHRRDVPETHYIYSINVTWHEPHDGDEQSMPSSPVTKTVFRRFREFYELQTKLAEQIGPGFDLPPLPSKIILRRSNTDEVASKRQDQLNTYLSKLLTLPDYISQSPLVLTFLTRFSRDDKEIDAEKAVSGVQGVTGSIKLSVTYDAHSQKLVVVVGHAKQLARTIQGTIPDPYVKLYLIPDPVKSSKKKTRVMKNTQHPTFNESFTFNLAGFSKVALQERQLQVSVWHHETLSKPFLGCVHFDMRTIMKQASEETVTDWYQLVPMFS